MTTNLAIQQTPEQQEASPANTHKLRRLTLVGWYLFDAIDIDLNFQATLFKGQNGSGKSSILDAIQTIMAGGDEHKIKLNGASSDKGGRSGRSLKAYCLGAVDDGNTRRASNSYLAMTFERPDGSQYAMGLSVYATEEAGRQAIKHTFVLPDSGFTSKELFVEEGQVATWEQFKRNNLAAKRQVIYPTSAQEFRDLYCESMGYDRRNKLASDMVFSSLSKGLALKQETDFTKFCRTQILPEDQIDVDRIEGTFTDFKKIKEQIGIAEEKQTLLIKIIEWYEKAIKSTNKAVAYNWAKAEAECVFTDNQLSDLSDRKEGLEASLAASNAALKQLEGNIPKLETSYESARDAYGKSEGAQQRETLKQEQNQLLGENRNHEHSERLLMKLFSDLVKSDIPGELAQHVEAQITNALTQLADTLGITMGKDLIQLEDASWCDDAAKVELVRESLDALAPAINMLKNHYEQLVGDLRDAQEAHKKIEEELNNARTGKVTYSRSTRLLIELLAESGIVAKPVGTLVSINDVSWQQAIESFLGGNREALVIFNDQGQPVKDSASIDRAIHEYRKLKNKHEEIGRSKIIKDIWEPRAASSFSNDIAASLIESDNEVALGYIQRQLGQVQLVETDAELRMAKKAVSRDGTVAANSTVGGTHRVDQWLIGVESAKRNAEILAKQYDDASQHLNRTSALKNKVDKLMGHLTKHTDQLGAMLGECVASRKGYHQRSERLTQIAGVLTEIAENNAAERLLKEGMEQAKANLDAARQDQLTLIKQQSSLEGQYSSLVLEIEKANGALTAATQKRKDAESQQGFDSAFASLTFAELEENLANSRHFEDDRNFYRALYKIAEEKHGKSIEAAASATRKASESLFSDYLGRYDVIDRNEFHDKDEQWRLTRCQDHLKQITDTDIVRYKIEAEQYFETLIKTFRSEVVSTLQDNFLKLMGLFDELNKSLKGIQFNGYRYRFTQQVADTETLKTIYEYAMEADAAELEAEPDTLFATNDDHPAIKIIESILQEERLDEIQDYRNFFTFDLQAKRVDDESIDGKWRSWDDLVGVGSGGEKGTPLYIALGASYMSAFKIRVINGIPHGGAAFCVFDEAFGKIDGNNTTSALTFLKQIGLQVILAAPPEDKLKMSQGVERTYGVIRSDGYVHLDFEEYTEAGKNLYLSDNPHVNQALIEERMKQMQAQRKVGSQKLSDEDSKGDKE